MNVEATENRTGRVSVVDPLSRAIDWTTRVLFRPFDPGKWLVLGFCAWLAGLGERGGGGSFNWHPSDGRHDMRSGLRESWDWVLAHLVPILIVGTVLVAVAIALWLLCLWLSSRGKFMFLDGVVRNRAAVVAPWRRYGAAGNALFLFRVLLGLVGLALVVATLAAAGLLTWLRFEGDLSNPPFVFGLILLLSGLIATALAFSLVALVVNDFLVPLMYLRNGGVRASWGELMDLFSARPGPFILYFLMRIVIGLIMAGLVLLTCCLTCCCVMVPYVGTVILLPLAVFLRAYSVCFLGQFGPRYERFAVLGPEVET